MMIEVLIAMLVFSIGVLGMVMLQAVSTANSVNSEDRMTAALLADDAVARMWTKGVPLSFSAADLIAWKGSVTTSRLGSSAVGSVTIAGNVATVSIQWPPRKGRSTDLATSIYSTQVVIE